MFSPCQLQGQIDWHVSEGLRRIDHPCAEARRICSIERTIPVCCVCPRHRGENSVSTGACVIIWRYWLDQHSEHLVIPPWVILSFWLKFWQLCHGEVWSNVCSSWFEDYKRTFRFVPITLTHPASHFFYGFLHYICLTREHKEKQMIWPEPCWIVDVTCSWFGSWTDH